ncbi:MAG: hypothetical protein J6N76_04090 [Lachnospiraceae bacterium]|nr:hypothetical protein [Lachnospiraceae bacterium]
MDEYFRVSAIFNLNGSASESFGVPYQNTRKKRSGPAFGKVFKTACDELKQNQAAHTKMRVVTLS